MKKVKKKTYLDKIDDKINDKIDEIKAKNKAKKKTNQNNKKSKVHKDIVFDIEEIERKEETNDYVNEYDTKSDIAESEYEETNSNDEELETRYHEDINDEEIIEDEIKPKEKDYDIIHDVSLEEEMTKKKKGKKLPKIKIHKFEDFKQKKKKKTEKNKKDKKKRSIWKKLLTIFLIGCIAIVLSICFFLGYIVLTAPEFDEQAFTYKDQTVIYDINGNIIAKLGTEKRESIEYKDLPQVLIDAIVATEDSRFYQHNGVDLFRFMKATIQQLLGNDDAGGASTLTMQTVKNNVTKKEQIENDTTLKGKIKKVVRKFQDVYIAVFKVEKDYTKEDILTMYINDNGLGSSYYGVEEASKYYFGKSASDLTLPEAALIAGLFQAPNRHNPYKYIENANKRRDLVLTLMNRHGYITKEEMEFAKSIPVESLLNGIQDNESVYQGYIDTVVEEVERITDHGDGTGGDNPYTVPMKIYTAMEPKIQNGINGILKDTSGSYFENEKSQTGIAVVNAENGTIAAVGAGRNKTGERQFNYATQAYRQPGSTSKPIFDYGPAIEYLNYSTYTLVNDEPWSYTNGPTVNNWDHDYYGLKTIKEHLKQSRNIPALKTFQAVGPKNSQKFAHSLGLDVSLNTSSENYHVFDNGLDNTINEAYSIGGAAKGYTPLDMASAYACFANGGYYIEPHTVTKIIYRETNEEKEFNYSKERVMKDSTAYIINNILHSAVWEGGLAGGARIEGSYTAAKTGTSNYDSATMQKYNLPGGAVNDLWTVGYTKQYTVAVWYGYENVDSKYYNTTDWFKTNITKAVMSYLPVEKQGWSMPSSVVAVTVEDETWPAMLPSEYTPADKRRTEYFVRGTQPTEVSPRYQKLENIKNVNTITNATNDNTATITWTGTKPKVITDSYLENYFNNSVYGNQKNQYLNKRKEYNSGVLGEYGYGIYKVNEDGTTSLIDFVTGNTYTYQGYGTTTLIIKAEYAKFKSNASDGVKVTLNLEELSSDKLKITLNGKSSIQANVGTYTELGVREVTYGTMDISDNNNLALKYVIIVNNETKEFDKIVDLEAYINTLEAGSYSINYVASYLGINVTKSRSLTLR